MKRKVVPTESVPAQWWVMVLPRQSVPGWVLAWAWRSERRKPELNHTKNQESDKVSASGHSRTHAHYGATPPPRCETARANTRDRASTRA